MEGDSNRFVSKSVREKGTPSVENVSKFTALDRFEIIKRRGRLFSPGEEVGNATSHGVGALASVAALVLLVIGALHNGGAPALAGALMFGVSLLAAYLSSTLYHAIQRPGAKRVLSVIDDASAYLLIAGSFAPFALVVLGVEQGGHVALAIVCALALAGVALEAVLHGRAPVWVRAALCAASCVVIATRIPALVAALPGPALGLLLAGVILYAAGIAFYLAKRVPFMHMVWHLLMLAGSVCHVLAVLLFVF